jgi:hypothetical protein
VKQPTARGIAFMIGGIAGAGVVFVPFAEGVSPLDVLLSPDPYHDPEARLWAAVFLVAIPILVSTCRQAYLGPLTKREVRAAYAFAFVALGATALLMLVFIVGLSGFTIAQAVTFPSVLIATVGAGAILTATRKARVPPATHAHVAMLVAWMVNGAWSLGLYAPGSGVGTGYYLAAVTLVAYAVEAVLRVRAARVVPLP